MSTTKENLSDKLLVKFVELCSSSSSHGVPNIFRTNNLLTRLMWILFLICSTSMCAFMVTRSILDYLKFDVVTKVRYFNEVPAEFPSITICNLNSFAKNETVEVMKDIYMRKYPNVSRDAINISDLAEVYNDFLYEANDHIFGDEKKKSLGYSIDEMLIYCSFNNNFCSSKDFSWFYMLFYGNCFRFNSGKDFNGNNVKLYKVYREGLFSGLTMQLFLSENEQFTVDSYDIGLKIFIDNRSSLINTFSRGILVQPGISLEIALHKVISEKLLYPYNNCQAQYPDDPIYTMYKSKGNIYKERDCVYLCLQKQIVQKCGCYDPWYDVFDENIRPCLNNSQAECANQFFAILYETGKNELCSKLCKPECSFVLYDISLSSSKYPSKQYCQTLKNSEFIINTFAKEGIDQENITDELIRSRMVSISIYLSDLYYTKINELEKMNLVDLIANIGGQLGLFLGISLLSFVEIGELFIELILLTKRHKNSQPLKIRQKS